MKSYLLLIITTLGLASCGNNAPTQSNVNIQKIERSQGSGLFFPLPDLVVELVRIHAVNTTSSVMEMKVCNIGTKALDHHSYPNGIKLSTPMSTMSWYPLNSNFVLDINECDNFFYTYPRQQYIQYPYEVQFKIDSDNQVSERNETNNVLIWTQSWMLPDYIPQGLPSSTVLSPSQIRYSFSIYNAGNMWGDVKRMLIKHAWSTNHIFGDSDDIPLPDYRLEELQGLTLPMPVVYITRIPVSIVAAQQSITIPEVVVNAPRPASAKFLVFKINTGTPAIYDYELNNNKGYILLP